MTRKYDVAIIGLGAMGSAAAWHLSRRGRAVVAFDQFDPGHDRGSSHGHSRIFRTAYSEGAAYVPLALRALDNWRTLEAEAGEDLLTLGGVLEAGAPGSAMVAGALTAARQFGLAHELLQGREINARFPGFELPEDWRGVLQHQAGFLRPERAIRACCELARKHGATLRVNDRVTALDPGPTGVRLTSASGRAVEASSVVVAAGAWIADLVPALKTRVTVTRQVTAWFAPPRPEIFTPSRFPAFILDQGDDAIYGVPDIDGGGVKIAAHWSGEVMRHADDPRAPATRAETQAIRAAAAPRVLAARGTLISSQTCVYTRTADEHFIIDLLPGEPRVVVASPCSGHGFKFASVIGEALADLATDGRTAIDIGMFAMNRAGLNGRAGSDETLNQGGA